MSDIAVSVEELGKRFRLYHERNQSLKSAVMRGRRSVQNGRGVKARA